ncbi:hypothetical protein DFH29DRAFT_1007407 [Suillus ampliporus]|nr:hypothetical protein DFH29DRAFT_1007407 [Suillus ampliporus]
MDEEQEREVVHEVKRERQVQRPPKVKPAPHVLHADIRYFIETGQIPAGSSVFTQVLTSLVNTTANNEKDQPSAPSKSKPTKATHLSNIWDEREDLFGVGDDSDEEDGTHTPRPLSQDVPPPGDWYCLLPIIYPSQE